MKCWSETIKLAKPLRDVRLGNPAATAVSADELQASYERGRIDGANALSAQLLDQRSEIHNLMNGALASLRSAVPQVIHDTESLMISLALEVAQKLIADMPVSVPMIEAAVRDTLSQVEGTAQFTVRLHPADLELLQKSGSPLLVSHEDAPEFRFLASPEVTRGGCLVQTRFGTVDARRETKFDLLRRNLLG